MDTLTALPVEQLAYYKECFQKISTPEQQLEFGMLPNVPISMLDTSEKIASTFGIITGSKATIEKSTTQTNTAAYVKSHDGARTPTLTFAFKISSTFQGAIKDQFITSTDLQSSIKEIFTTFAKETRIVAAKAIDKHSFPNGELRSDEEYAASTFLSDPKDENIARYDSLTGELTINLSISSITGGSFTDIVIEKDVLSDLMQRYAAKINFKFAQLTTDALKKVQETAAPLSEPN